MQTFYGKKQQQKTRRTTGAKGNNFWQVRDILKEHTKRNIFCKRSFLIQKLGIHNEEITVTK